MNVVVTTVPVTHNIIWSPPFSTYSSKAEQHKDPVKINMSPCASLLPAMHEFYCTKLCDIRRGLYLIPKLQVEVVRRYSVIGHANLISCSIIHLMG